MKIIRRKFLFVIQELIRASTGKKIPRPGSQLIAVDKLCSPDREIVTVLDQTALLGGVSAYSHRAVYYLQNLYAP